MSRIAVFGGTFNPPHNGHIAAARACVAQLAADRMIFIPTALPPHKDMPRTTAEPAQRLYMARLAAELVQKAEVSDMEIKRGGISYTSDTLAELHALYPDDELWFLIGTDMLLTLERWHEPARICALAGIAVAARSAGEYEEIERAAEHLRRVFGARVEMIRGEPVPVSSTQVRAGDADDIPQSIAEYIKEQCLYRDVDALRESVRGRMSERRFLHTLGCEKLCAELAQIWGENPQRARCAALLHDVTKEKTTPEQLLLCEKYGIIHSYDAENIDALLHADTAAAVAGDEYGMGEAVCMAIRLHTVGGTEMTTLDKILYVADACEESRRWDGAFGMRELAKRDLDAAAIKMLGETVTRLEKCGGKPYYKTEEALAAMQSAAEGKNKNG